MAILTTLSLSALLGLASAQVVKDPLLESAVSGFREDFENVLPKSPSYTVDKWTADELSQGAPTDSMWYESVMDEESDRYCGDGFSAYNVTYEDCPEPWLIGHCNKAARDLDSTIKLLGRLPSGLRAAISDLIHPYMEGSTIGGSGSSMVVGGEFGPDHVVEMAVRAVVFAEGVDLAAFAGAVDADTCVADEESAADLNKSDPGYGIAVYRAGILMAYEKLVGKLPVDISCMSNQVQVLGPMLNPRLEAEGQCPNKTVPTLEKMQKIVFPGGFKFLESDRMPGSGGSVVNAWEPGSYPEFCYDEASATRDGQDVPRCTPENLSVYNVTYSDCPDQDPWAICRCNDAQLTLDQMVARFGRVPPALRSHVRHIVAFDGSDGKGGEAHAHAGTLIPTNAIIFWGPCPDYLFLHEAGHCIDQDFSVDPKFTEAVEKDTCIPSNYAKNSPAELFAELGVTYLYDRNTKSMEERGIDVTCMSNQLQALDEYVGKQLTRSESECFERTENTAVVTPGESEALFRTKPFESEVVREDPEPHGRDADTRSF